MAKQICVDGYVFDFGADVVDAFVFDEPSYKVPAMKAVDIIAEFPNEYLFIELKKYDPARGGIEFRCPLWGDKTLIASHCPLAADITKRNQASVKRIARELRQKYCDTFLYRYAEGRIGKTVNYICVVSGCDSALTLHLQEIVKNAMPKGLAKTTWIRPIVKNVAVVNVDMWNASSKLSQYGNCRLV